MKSKKAPISIIIASILVIYIAYFFNQTAPNLKPNNLPTYAQSMTPEKYAMIIKKLSDNLLIMSKNISPTLTAINAKYSELHQIYQPSKNPLCLFDKDSLKKILSPTYFNNSQTYYALAECIGIIFDQLLKEKDFTTLTDIILDFETYTKTNNLNNEETRLDAYYITRIAAVSLITIDLILPNLTNSKTIKDLNNKKIYFNEKINQLLNEIESKDNANYLSENISTFCIKSWAFAPIMSKYQYLDKQTLDLNQFIDKLYLGIHKHGEILYYFSNDLFYCIEAINDSEGIFKSKNLNPEASSILLKIIQWNINELGDFECGSTGGFIGVYNSEYSHSREQHSYCEKFPPSYINNYRILHALKRITPYL